MTYSRFSWPLEQARRSSTESLARWDRHFFEDALHVARKSKDRSTKCGCVIVNERQVALASGWNGFPRGVNDDVDERHERPAKYQWTEHAERNAIYNAAAEGVALRGATAYITGLPCADCARALIQAGVRRIVTIDKDTTSGKHDFGFDVSMTMFQEAGLGVCFLEPDEPEA